MAVTRHQSKTGGRSLRSRVVKSQPPKSIVKQKRSSLRAKPPAETARQSRINQNILESKVDSTVLEDAVEANDIGERSYTLIVTALNKTIASSAVEDQPRFMMDSNVRMDISDNETLTSLSELEDMLAVSSSGEEDTINEGEETHSAGLSDGSTVEIELEDGRKKLVKLHLENEWDYGDLEDKRHCESHGTEYLCPLPSENWVFPFQFEDPEEVGQMLERMLIFKTVYHESADCRAELHEHIRCVKQKGQHIDLGPCYLVLWKPYWFQEDEVLESR